MVRFSMICLCLAAFLTAGWLVIRNVRVSVVIEPRSDLAIPGGR